MKKTLLTLALSALCFSAAGAASLTIAEQGSFAAGGSVIEAKTAYDPYHPTPDGQTLHGDHAFVSYQIPENPSRTVVKGSARSFCVGIFRSIPWISLGAAEPGAQRLTVPSRQRPTKASGSGSSVWGCGRNLTTAVSSRRTLSPSISSFVR